MIDDVIGSGTSLDACLERLTVEYSVLIAAVICIADTQIPGTAAASGAERICEKYHTCVFSLITDEDIQSSRRSHII